MYRIKKDKRIQTSAEMLSDALRQILSERNMSEIGITDICTCAGVSRATFYRIFDAPIDVLTYTCDGLCEKILADYTSANISNRDSFVLFSLKYWFKHHDILEAMENCGRRDIIQNSLLRHSTKLVPEIAQYFTENQIDYLRTFAIGTLEGVLHTWIMHGRKETPEEIYTIYKKISILAIDTDRIINDIFC